MATVVVHDTEPQAIIIIIIIIVSIRARRFWVLPKLKPFRAMISRGARPLPRTVWER